MCFASNLRILSPLRFLNFLYPKADSRSLAESLCNVQAR
jgi:hypothetical protein